MEARKILIVTLVPSHPPTAGNRIRSVTLGKVLRQQGFTVHFLYQDYIAGDVRQMKDFWGDQQFFYLKYRSGSLKYRIRRFIRSLRINQISWLKRCFDRPLTKADPARPRASVDSEYDPALGETVEVLHKRHRYSAIISQFVITSKALERVPSGVVKVIDTQEVFAIGREVQRKNGERLWIDISVADEIMALRRADVLWTYQDLDAALLRQKIGTKVYCISHFVETVDQIDDASRTSKNIIFVAAKHHANIVGLRWFHENVFPRVSAWLNPRNIVVVGSICEALENELPYRFLGVVGDLKDVYRDSRIAISPIISGTGLKSKNMEAFGFGKPVVSTKFAAIGMEGAEERAHISSDEPEIFANAITVLMEDDKLWSQMAVGALRFAGEWNKEMRSRLIESLS